MVVGVPKSNALDSLSGAAPASVATTGGVSIDGSPLTATAGKPSQQAPPTFADLMARHSIPVVPTNVVSEVVPEVLNETEVVDTVVDTAVESPPDASPVQASTAAMGFSTDIGPAQDFATVAARHLPQAVAVAVPNTHETDIAELEQLLQTPGDNLQTVTLFVNPIATDTKLPEQQPTDAVDSDPPPGQSPQNDVREDDSLPKQTTEQSPKISSVTLPDANAKPLPSAGSVSKSDASSFDADSIAAIHHNGISTEPVAEHSGNGSLSGTRPVIFPTATTSQPTSAMIPNDAGVERSEIRIANEPVEQTIQAPDVALPPVVPNLDNAYAPPNGDHSTAVHAHTTQAVPPREAAPVVENAPVAGKVAAGRTAIVPPTTTAETPPAEVQTPAASGDVIAFNDLPTQAAAAANHTASNRVQNVQAPVSDPDGNVTKQTPLVQDAAAKPLNRDVNVQQQATSQHRASDVTVLPQTPPSTFRDVAVAANLQQVTNRGPLSADVTATLRAELPAVAGTVAAKVAKPKTAVTEAPAVGMLSGDASSINAVATAPTITQTADIMQQLATEVVQRVQTLEVNREQRFTLRLDPPELGKLVISMRRTASGIELHVDAADPVTQNLIQAGFDELNSDSTDTDSVFRQLNIDVTTGDGSGRSPHERRQSFVAGRINSEKVEDEVAEQAAPDRISFVA